MANYILQHEFRLTQDEDFDVAEYEEQVLELLDVTIAIHELMKFIECIHPAPTSKSRTHAVILWNEIIDMWDLIQPCIELYIDPMTVSSPKCWNRKLGIENQSIKVGSDLVELETEMAKYTKMPVYIVKKNPKFDEVLIGTEKMTSPNQLKNSSDKVSSSFISLPHSGQEDRCEITISRAQQCLDTDDVNTSTSVRKMIENVTWTLQ